ncbi:DUF1573 domain-containing protein [candidate division KSB1 bacterium]|nr:DUF1573 domain-containing protein [candidate division KSB1 bacterium]
MNFQNVILHPRAKGCIYQKALPAATRRLSKREKKLIQKLAIYLCIQIALILKTAAFASPILEAENAQFDFGIIREGTNVPVHFNIKNTGTETAIIKEIRTFAACVESRPLRKRELAPGELMTLAYVFESLGYGGVSVAKKIEVYYNHRDQRPLVLRVKGVVLPLEPFQVPLGELAYNFFVLVDVRPQSAFAREHIIGAINVPVETIEKWVREIAANLSGEIIIYLYSEDGKDSDSAAQKLRKQGYTQFVSIVGGLNEWKKQKGNKYLISGTR